MISAIIPTRNRPRLLEAVIAAILDNSIIPEQIIIIDSSDEKERFSRNYFDNRVQYHTTEIKSAAIQRNLGLNFVPHNTNYLAFLDDDIEIKNDYFADLIKTLKSTNSIGVSGLALNPKKNTEDKNKPNLVSRFFLNNSKKNGIVLRSGINIPVKTDEANPVKTEWLIGCALWDYQRMKFLRFETDFYGQSLGEDVVFSLKASKYGTLHVNTSVLISHFESDLMRPNPEEFFLMWIKNRLRIIKYTKNPKLNLVAFHWANLGKILQILISRQDYKRSKFRGIMRGYKSIFGFES